MVHSKPRYRFLFLSALLLSFHFALTVYINSSFLSNYFSEQAISRLYMAGSIVTIIALIASSRILRRFGNYHLVLLGLIAEIAALLTLAFTANTSLLAFAFIAHQALPALLLFGMDIFFEGTLAQAKDAERVRSYYLMFVNIAFVAAPLTVAAFVVDDSFQRVYILSAILVIILWFIVANVFHRMTPQKYREIGFANTFRAFMHRKYLSTIFILNFLLQCFFAIMIIFTGPYLHNTIGMSWESIGVIFTIMLIPFVIFNAPLGKLFDKYHDEREVIIAGYIIIMIALLLIANTTSTSIVVWAGLLFLSRVGASFVETATEAAFFKRMTTQDSGFIGIFRLSSPLSYVIAPFIASLFLAFVSVNILYFILAFALIPGIVLAYKKL